MKIEHIIVAIFSDSVNALKCAFQHAASLYYASNLNMGVLNGKQNGVYGRILLQNLSIQTLQIKI